MTGNLLFPSDYRLAPKGLRYVQEYITQEDHDRLLQAVDEQHWSTQLSRRVQHYGWKYDYKSRRVNPEDHIGPLPEWSIALAERLMREKMMNVLPDQLIVNEYQPGQGIASHIDCVPCFTDTIACVSLGSPIMIELKHVQTREVYNLFLQPKSLLVLASESRYDWVHGIPKRKSDFVDDKVVRRGRRVSLTYRRVLDPREGDATT